MITLYFEGVLLGLLVAISLGPAFFAIIQTSINKGFKYGVFMALGISLSDIVLVTISYLIGATLFDDSQNKVYVGLIGGIILIIFGSVSWAKKPEILKRRNVNYQTPAGKPLVLYTIRGFFLNVANPFLFFFWFGALGFVGKNAIEGNMLESTLVFFSGTFSIVFATDILKSYIGGKIKGFLRPRKELILNKTVGIALVIFGVVLIFRTLDGIGFFERLEDQTLSTKQIEAQYNIKAKNDNLALTLFKDSSFITKADVGDSIYNFSGSWRYIDTAKTIFEITILQSNMDTNELHQKRMYKLGITGIIPYVDSLTMGLAPDELDFNKDFSIEDIVKSSLVIPQLSQQEFDCEGWSLNSQQISKIIKSAKPINSNTWNNDFELFPCLINAVIKQDGKLFNLQINAGSWFTVTANDSSIYFGSYKVENQGLFIAPAKE